MSGVVKAVGKAFKKVTKVIKKIALPALAIGAVIVTGGAALGLAPFAGGLAGVVGATGALGSILGAAGTGALIGAGGALLTGKNIIKGATGGLVAGAVTGGLSAALGGAATAGNLAKTGSEAVNVASKGLDATKAVTTIGKSADLLSKAAPLTQSSGGLLGAVSQMPQVAKYATPVANAAPAANTAPAVNPVANSNVKTAVANAGNTAAAGPAGEVANPQANVPGGSNTIAPTTSAGGGGLAQFLQSQPYLLPQVLQGIGGGINRSAEYEAEYEGDRRRREMIEDNYSTEGFYGTSAPVGTGSYGYSAPVQRGRWAIDPITGKPFREVRAG